MSSGEPARVSRPPRGPALVRPLRGAAALLALCVAAGCAKPPAPPPPPPPTEIVGVVQAAPGLNPSVRGRASPLVLRIYELRSANAFSAADFVSLYQRDQAELGADLVARDEFVLAPGERREFLRRAAPETRYLGVLAAYRDLERARWRAVAAVLPGQKQRLLIDAGALAVTVTATVVP